MFSNQSFIVFNNLNTAKVKFTVAVEKHLKLKNIGQYKIYKYQVK